MQPASTVIVLLMASTAADAVQARQATARLRGRCRPARCPAPGRYCRPAARPAPGASTAQPHEGRDFVGRPGRRTARALAGEAAAPVGQVRRRVGVVGQDMRRADGGAATIEENHSLRDFEAFSNDLPCASFFAACLYGRR